MSQGTIGIVGLGRIGGNLARQALEKDWEVVGYTKGGPSPHLIAAGLKAAISLSELKASLAQRRVILLYIPAGKDVDHLLTDLAMLLDPGDIVIDGGNSYWGDSMRRYEAYKRLGLDFIDLGTSGGVSGARTGACFMAGGDKKAVAYVQNLLETLAVPNGFVHAGPAGAGHFTKLVHNGIEFGMLQAIGEGVDLLGRWPHARLEPEHILACWAHGSVIRSWLIELMQKACREQGDLAAVSSYIEDTGEVNWLISDALHLEAPIPVIAQAVMQLFASRDHSMNWARAVSMMRHGFGGHPLGPDKAIAEERQSGRIADAFMNH